MSYVPTTDPERRAMLDAIGVKEFDALVQAVPADLRFPHLRLPGALSEMEALREFGALAEQNADAVRYPDLSRRGRVQPFHARRRAPHRLSRRVLHRVHPVSAGSLAGHLAGHLRVPDAS